jgi:NitT/TauT family transport system substrate-binding protein
METKRLLRGLIGIGFGAAGLTFATGAFAQTKVDFQLNWYAGGANAGFAAALQQGYYKSAGLDVTIIQGNGSANTAQLVANGRAEVAYADAVAVSQLIAKGAPMKIVATVYQSNPNEVEALKKANIKSVQGLKGKKVGIPAGGSQSAMLPLFLEANHIKPSEVDLINMPSASMVPALLQGSVDAILGSVDDFGIQIKSHGQDFDHFMFADHGVPTVSTSIFARDSYIKDHPDVLKKFIAASLKGWVFALDHQDKAVADLKKTFPDVDTKLATAQLAAIPPLFCSGGTKYIGKATDEHWALTQKLLAQVKLLPEGKDPKIYYTNALLPPESEMHACK